MTLSEILIPFDWIDHPQVFRTLWEMLHTLQIHLNCPLAPGFYCGPSLVWAPATSSDASNRPLVSFRLLCLKPGYRCFLKSQLKEVKQTRFCCCFEDNRGVEIIESSKIETTFIRYGAHQTYKGLPGGSDGKESVCNVEDRGSIPGLGRSPGEGNGNPPQYSCLKNPMDRGAWRAIAHRITKSWTQLRDYTFQTYKLRPLPSRPSFRNLLMNHTYTLVECL